MENKKSKTYKQILEILPELQSEIWKKLNIKRRRCSEIMSEMAELGLIKRTKKGGTFMVDRIEKVNNNIPKNDFSALLSGSGKISPCCGCTQECNPALCLSLDKWTKDGIKT